MNYAEMRQNAITGDVLMTQSSSLVGRLIRVFTGESVNHIGMLLWIDNSLFVSEFVEFRGYQLLPASLWVQDRIDNGENVYYGVAPATVRQNSDVIRDMALAYRKQSYGYLSLIKIWLSQVLRLKIKTRRFVCSSYVGEMYREAGYNMVRTPDPGDFFEVLQRISIIN